MTARIDAALQTELHDVFHVKPVTRGTPIESRVGADLVHMNCGVASRVHRHNQSETVLFIVSGQATVYINHVAHKVQPGQRILIHAGEYHSVTTPADSGCEFLSLQTPPIIDPQSGFRDLEELPGQSAAG